MAEHNDLGNKGEQVACDFLLTKGFSIIGRNYRYRRAEIDIIAKKDKLLVFVEVKSRTNIQFGEPEASVSNKKASLIVAAAENYIIKADWLYDIRFDIISIRWGAQPFITHLEDAFY